MVYILKGRPFGEDDDQPLAFWAFPSIFFPKSTPSYYHLPFPHMDVGQNLVPLVNPKIAGKWMFIPLKLVLIGIDPYPHWCSSRMPMDAPSPGVHRHAEASTRCCPWVTTSGSAAIIRPSRSSRSATWHRPRRRTATSPTCPIWLAWIGWSDLDWPKMEMMGGRMTFFFSYMYTIYIYI